MRGERRSSATSFLASALVVIEFLLFAAPKADGLGSMSTVAVAYGTGTVCGIRSGRRVPQSIECVVGGAVVQVLPSVSFNGIAGGRDFFCGLRAGGLQLLCWEALAMLPGNGTLSPKRIYNSATMPLAEATVGESHVCAIHNATGAVGCWRPFRDPAVDLGGLRSITAGRGFSCGISVAENRRVLCWAVAGDGAATAVASDIQAGFAQSTAGLLTLVAGESHACGVAVDGALVCHGKNDSGQLNAPQGPPFSFTGLALGRNWSCAIRKSNGTTVCWGGGFPRSYPNDTSFESIVSGDDFVCGLTTGKLSVVCWGLNRFNPARAVPLPQIIPGRCTRPAECQCGPYPDSENLCSASLMICALCSDQPPPPPPPFLSPPPSLSPSGSSKSKGLIAFAAIGSLGALSGIATVVYCMWSGICCCRQQRIHNSVQPRIAGVITTSPSRSSVFRRQRSGTSSTKPIDRGAEEFSFSELSAATNGFAAENIIGAGSFGTVYRGKLSDGREVAIKRGEIGPRTKKFQEKESAFQSELAFLSRLHHKHLVSLVGFCEELEERLLVYEFMHNGALYDHLHTRNEPSSHINSWRTRIRIALDAARGIEYLHNYAVPPIIHRDIKSSNILLDIGWTARVSDFGLSLKGPDAEDGHLNLVAAGTVGYMDPEYYGLQHLTTKSDVYGFGVVMLEMLTGKRAIHKDEATGTPVSVVDFAVGKIISDELTAILDRRVAPPQGAEAEAVELMAYMAAHCVNLDGRERPSMTDIVANLERAVSRFSESHGSISSNGISSVSL
ncbi:putative serine/threonine-protein kinase-like protein CCR3 [Nymphaea colorata]|nr:putative serine/threonine-protein kinase-like protein CCR3 [Nymphaea colorata]